MPSFVFDIPASVKVLLTGLFSDKTGPYDTKLTLIAASERRGQISALTDLLKPYTPLELDINDHSGFKRLESRVQWKETIDVMIRLPRRLDFRSEAYYDLTKLVNQSHYFGIRNLVIIGTWEVAQEAPNFIRDMSYAVIELYSRGYSLKVSEV